MKIKPGGFWFFFIWVNELQHVKLYKNPELETASLFSQFDAEKLHWLWWKFLFSATLLFFTTFIHNFSYFQSTNKLHQ